MIRWRQRKPERVRRGGADRVLGCLPRKTLLGAAGPAMNPFEAA